MSWKYIFIAVFATVILAFSFFASSRIKKPIKIALTIVWCACAALLLWKGIKTLDIRILLLFLFSDLFGLSAGCISTLISSQKASEKRAEDLKQALARSPKLREAVSAASDGLSALIDCCARYNCIVLQREGGGTFLIAGGVIYARTTECFGLVTNDVTSEPFFFTAKMFLQQTYSTRQSSVVGRAVAGGIIAGGAGAVAGAISAANKNARGGVTQTGYSYGGYYLSVKDPIKRRRDPIASVYISNKVIERIGYPSMLSRNKRNEKEGYVEFKGFRGAYNTEGDIQQLINYINAVLNMSLED